MGSRCFVRLIELFFCRYLKQQFQFQPSDRICSINWDSTNPLVLRILCSSGVFTEHHFVWETQLSQGLSSKNPVQCGVIDGAKLLLTPLRWVLPPPPLAHQTIQTQDAISSFCWSPKFLRLAILHHDRLVFYCKNENNELYYLIDDSQFSSIHSSALPGILDIKQMAFKDENTLIAVCTRQDKPDYILEISLKFSGTQAQHTISFEVDSVGPVLKMFHNSDTNRTFLQFIDGSVSVYSNGTISGWSVDLSKTFSFPTPSPQFQSVVFNGQVIFLQVWFFLYLSQAFLTSYLVCPSLDDPICFSSFYF